jgi:hypothetical protein
MRTRLHTVVAGATLAAAAAAFALAARRPTNSAGAPPPVTPEPAAASAPPAASAAEDDLGPVGDDPCARPLARNAAAVARAVEAFRRGSRDSWCADGPGEVAPDDRGGCYAAEGVAWAKVMEDVSICARSVRWRLVAIAEGGTVAYEEAFDEEQEFTTSRAFRTGDVDGDGRPDVIFEEKREGAEVSGVAFVRAFSLRDGRVREVDLVGAPGGLVDRRGFPRDRATAVDDVDGDGRLDAVVTYGGLPVHVTCGGYRSWVEPAVTLFRHGTAAGLSSVDEAARAYARRTCPAPPRGVVATDRAGNVDDDATYRNVVCARAWGADAAAVKRQIEHACKPWMRDECEGPDAAKRPGECWQVEELTDLAELVPVVFARGDPAGPRP